VYDDARFSPEVPLQLRHLRYFVAVAEEGSVLRAARRLHIAQPSVSKQIQDLEREVGCALFERGARGVRLTVAGDAFLLEARRTLENAERAIESARSAQGNAKPRFSLALGKMTYYPSILTELLATFHRLHPECEFRMRQLTNVRQRSALRAHTISAAVAWMSGPPEEFASQVIQDCSLQGVLLPASHPLAQQSYISLPQLQPLVRLHHPRRVHSDLYVALRAELLARGLAPSRMRAVPLDITTIGMHIAAGDAYMVSNEVTARAYTSGSTAVVYRRFSEKPIPVSLVLFWRLYDTSSYLESLAEIARNSAVVTEAVA
jgi:LysR family transcriptional regulator, hca operon transcriptional activator